MRDMSDWYFKQPSQKLRALRSQKVTRKAKLEAHHMGYFDLQEVRTLVAQIRWIDAVLAAREAQQRLL